MCSHCQVETLFLLQPKVQGISQKWSNEAGEVRECQKFMRHTAENLKATYLAERDKAGLGVEASGKERGALTPDKAWYEGGVLVRRPAGRQAAEELVRDALSLAAGVPPHAHPVPPAGHTCSAVPYMQCSAIHALLAEWGRKCPEWPSKWGRKRAVDC